MNPDVKDKAGFTILEVLIAFMILASALVVASQTIARSVQSAHRASEYQRVLSLIDDLRADQFPALRDRAGLSGTGGDFEWTIARIGERPSPVASVTITGRRLPRYRFLITLPAFEDERATRNDR